MVNNQKDSMTSDEAKSFREKNIHSYEGNTGKVEKIPWPHISYCVSTAKYPEISLNMCLAL